MEKINIDRKITERADEFAEREYVCGADERAHLSKGYYWGYKDAQKDLALSWEDIRSIIELYELRKAEDAAFDACDYEALLYEFNSQREKK